MDLVKFDDRVYDLLDPAEPLEKLSTGYVFTEGPVYHDGVHHFTDFQVNKIYRYEKGKVSCINDDSYFTIGLTYDRRKNRVLGCTREKHAITDLDGNIIIDNYNGVRINGSNDLVVDTKGRIFFSDPLSRAIEGEQIGHSSVFMYDEDNKKMTMIESTFTRPNGLAFSPDESILYIIDSNTVSIHTMDIKTFKTKFFIEFDKSYGPGGPDGMRLDIDGNIYCTGPGGIWLITPEAKILGLIKTPEVAANLCFDDTGIFITASTSIYHLNTKKRSAV